MHDHLGSLFQWPTTLSVKKFFLMANLNFPSCSFFPFPYVLLLVTRKRRSKPPPLLSPLRGPLSLLLNRLGQKMLNRTYQIVFSLSAKILQFSYCSFDIQILPQNLICFKNSVNSLMLPFHFGIQKCKGLKLVCHLEPTYLPVEWIFILKKTCWFQRHILCYSSKNRAEYRT